MWWNFHTLKELKKWKSYTHSFLFHRYSYTFTSFPMQFCLLLLAKIFHKVINTLSTPPSQLHRHTLGIDPLANKFLKKKFFFFFVLVNIKWLLCFKFKKLCHSWVLEILRAYLLSFFGKILHFLIWKIWFWHI